MENKQPTESPEPLSPLKSALFVSLGYLIFGALWVLLTDKAVILLFPNKSPEYYAWINTYKGWLFFILSGSWLYFIVHGRMRRVLISTHAMERSRERMKRMLEMAREGILTLDIKQRTTYANPEMARMLRRAPEDLIGVPINEILHPSSYSAWDGITSQSSSHIASQDIQFLSPDGENFWGIVNVSRMSSDPSIAYMVMVNDVTDRRRNEEHIRRTQRLESVGRLASGISHDFNNILAIILGYADSMARHFPEDSPSREHIGEIQKAAERGADLVKRLLAFARSQKDERVTLNLASAINELFPMLKRIIPKTIELTWTPPDKPLMINVGAGQIEHVLINLVVNAMEANPKSIRLSAGTQNLIDSDAKAIGLPPGEFVFIDVVDTGAGMDEQTLSHIFEPFFTTKKGKSTGFGMSVVASIVHDCAGQISVKSIPEQGTSFRIWIPPHPNPNTGVG